MTLIHFSDGTDLTVYESPERIVRGRSTQHPWMPVSLEYRPNTEVVINCNYIVYVEDLENGNSHH